ncbi:hypothetical protein NMY22_g18306 [Coprinellus aureogranulatus]|nr:hypothetical protein NMY22_g18306 [Coprinellus aureogranulatus]
MSNSGITMVAPVVCGGGLTPTSLSHPAPSAHPLSYEPSPPSYGEARRSAIENDLSETRTSMGAWVIIRCPEDSSSTPILGDLHNPSPPLENPESFPEKIPEFYQALTEFDEAHSNLQGHARAICSITKKLLAIQKEISDIHEYWLEKGMHDVAHDVIPILDSARELLPESSFLPHIPRTAAPGS